MPRYVAFLRGINLGKRRLEMARLRTLFEEMGHEDVETFIASGNVIFTTGARNISALEAATAKYLEGSLGYDVDTFIRTLDGVAAIAASSPFPDADGSETVHVAFLHNPLSNAAGRALTDVRSMDDEFCVDGAEYYWLCRIRTSDSKIWASPEMKSLSLPRATMRNMSSIRKLVAKFGDRG